MDDTAVDLNELRRFVQTELESYRYEVPEGALGKPFPDEWVQRQLAEMRAALVDPEWRIVVTVDTQARRTPYELRCCVLVADDRDGFQLYYDPLEGDFALATNGQGPPTTIGVRGDAVGCFLAR